MKAKRILLVFLTIILLFPSISVYADNKKTEKTTETTTETTTEAKDEKSSGKGYFVGPHFQQWGGNPIIHDSGCTVLSLQHICQNSGILSEGDNGDYQLSNNKNYVNTTDKFDNDKKKYSEWDSFLGTCPSGFQSGTGDAWTLSNFPNTVKWLSSNKVTATLITDEDSNFKDFTAGEGYAFIGMGKKKFEDMTAAEFTEAMKVFYEAGYYCVVCVWYVNNHVTNNAEGGQGANHATCFSGFDSSGTAYLYDSGCGTYVDAANGNYNISFEDAYNYKYRFSYVVAWELSNGKMKDKCGGVSQKADKETAEDIGIDGMIQTSGNMNGYYSADQLGQYAKVGEVTIDFETATIDSFGQTDRDALETWKTNVESERDKNSVNAWIRRIVMIFGIMITIWSLLIYIAYWFDRLNNLLDFSLLELLTFQKLSLSDTEENCTFSLRHIGEKKRTVNHRAILIIAVIGIVFGALLISGTIYKAIYIVVRKVLSLMYG